MQVQTFTRLQTHNGSQKMMAAASAMAERKRSPPLGEPEAAERPDCQPELRLVHEHAVMSDV